MRRLFLITCFIMVVALPTLLAQKFAIGYVDYFGFRNVSKVDVTACLTFHAGDTVDINVLKKAGFIACMEKVPGVLQADFNLVCCDESGRLLLFIGISEKPRPALSANGYTKEVSLPDSVVFGYDSLMQHTMEAVVSGQAEEDDSQGHALLKYEPARKFQEEHILFANQHVELLRDVLKNSRFEKHRVAASWVIAYHRDKAAILHDLEEATGDPDEEVRNNATRALGILINYSLNNNLNFKISPDPFIRMINAVTWTDLNKAAFVLLYLTNSHDKQLLEKLRREALDPLIDMALWKSKGHNGPAYIILCRIAGWTDDQIRDNMDKDRVVVVEALLKDIKKLPD